MEGNKKKYLIWFWALFTVPFVIIIALFILISKGKLGPMPSFTELENPEYSLAAEVIPRMKFSSAKYILRTEPGPITGIFPHI